MAALFFKEMRLWTEIFLVIRSEAMADFNFFASVFMLVVRFVAWMNLSLFGDLLFEKPINV